MNAAALLGSLAVLPMVTGPLPQAERTLTMGLCDGGEITIPIDGNRDSSPPDCHQKACHAGTCRQKGERSKTRFN